MSKAAYLKRKMQEYEAVGGVDVLVHLAHFCCDQSLGRDLVRLGLHQLLAREVRKPNEDLQEAALAGLANLALNKEVYDVIDLTEIEQFVSSLRVATRRSALLLLYFYPGPHTRGRLPVEDQDSVCSNLLQCIQLRQANTDLL